MNSELLPYYERELVFVRKIAAEFAAQYPDRADALGITPDACDDPHVERIIQAFALIAGRIQHRLDQEFPEITSALLELLYPHLLRPLPSLAMIQFAVDPEIGNQPGGHPVPRFSTVLSAPIRNVRCQFRTAYDTWVWPLTVLSAAFGNSTDIARGIAAPSTPHSVRIEIEVLGGHRLSQLALQELRFRIGGKSQQAPFWMYEVVFNRVKRILLRPVGPDGRPERDANDRTISLAPDSIRPVGYDRHEALLPVAETSFQGYRLLQEYFSYPEKFLFFDLAGLDAVPRERLGNRFEILLLVEQMEMPERVAILEASTGPETFQLGCTPAINLFSHIAEPIRLSHTRTEYQVDPDTYAPGAFEVYSVDRVVSVAPNVEETKEYLPFYSLNHDAWRTPPTNPEGRPGTGDKGVRRGSGPNTTAFWCGFRRPSAQSEDHGTDFYLSFVDRDFKVSRPAHEAVTAHITCSNRDLPLAIKPRREWGEVDLEANPLLRARLVDGPTRAHRREFSGDLQWRLISHLSLNHLSLVEGGVGALGEILRLYDTAETRATADQIEGLKGLRSAQKISRLDSEHGFVFCSGVGIDLEMDEDRFAGGGAYLMASILDRFFGLYCALNSFTQLRVSTRQRKGIGWQWPIRSGEQVVA